MAIQKNFVVKNGLEVSEALIYADKVADQVGIGTTSIDGNCKVEVRGNLKVRNLYLAETLGIGSIPNLQGTTVDYGYGRILSGVVTSIVGTSLTYSSGVINKFYSVSGFITSLAGSGVTYTNGYITSLHSTNLDISGISTFDANVRFEDTRQLTFGQSDDLKIYHDGSNSIIRESGAGNLVIGSNGPEIVITKDYGVEDMARFNTDGSVELYYNNVQKFQTTKDGILIDPGVGLGRTAGEAEATQDLAVFQTSNSNLSQIKIKEVRDISGTDNTSAYTRIQKITGSTNQGYIQFNGNGNVNGIEFGTVGDEKFAEFKQNGLVSLYYDNVKKFETISDGVKIFDDTVNPGILDFSPNGVITSRSGIVTYYGDGNNLDLYYNDATGIGIGTTGGLVGYAVTFLDLKGDGISTAYYGGPQGITTIFFEDKKSGTIAIGTLPPPNPKNGQTWYSTEYARTFVYIKEDALGFGGAANVWVDAAPFNVGIISALSRVSFDPGNPDNPAIFFNGDGKTGIFSPNQGNFNVVSIGTTILNINQKGANVYGGPTRDGYLNVNDTGINVVGVASVNNKRLIDEQTAIAYSIALS